MFLGAAYLISVYHIGVFLAWFCLCTGVLLAIRGHRPKWFIRHIEERKIVPEPAHDVFSWRAWSVAGILVLSVAYIGYGIGNVYVRKQPGNLQTNTALKKIVPLVYLRFVSPRAPVLLIGNSSDITAEKIIWDVLLWDLDRPDLYNPLLIPSGTIDWIKPHKEVGPQGLFTLPTVYPLLRTGDRLFGCAMVNCRDCSSGQSYVVSIVWGRGGWTSEIKSSHAGELPPIANLSTETREKYFQMLEEMAPLSSHIPIGEWP